MVIPPPPEYIASLYTVGSAPRASKFGNPDADWPSLSNITVTFSQQFGNNCMAECAGDARTSVVAMQMEPGGHVMGV
jgi:hypothetical protein